jgi:DNA-binding XRE family transcriptional regulator
MVYRRRLCRNCYDQPEVREAYPSFLRRGDIPLPACERSAAVGGDEAKILDMAQRRQLEQALFAEGDGVIPWPDWVRQMPFGKKIAWLRNERRWTQAHLARKAGLTQPAICYLETMTYRPKLTTVLALAEAFCEPLEKFLGGRPAESRRMEPTLTE